MQSSELYQQTLEGFKTELSSFPGTTLFEYCHSHHVYYSGMKLWLSRHQISIRSLKQRFDSPFPGNNNLSSSVFVPLSSSSERSLFCAELLQGIHITFPDGVIVTIKRGTASAIQEFIKSYNQSSDSALSCLL